MDEIYVKKVIAGDRNAFRFLVEKYKDRSLNIAFNIVKEKGIAEDVVQDAFITLFQKIHTFQFKAKFSTWLYRIVVNRALDLTKKQRDYFQAYDISDYENVNMEDVQSSMHLISDKERRKYIQKVLGRMNDKDALMLNLFYLEEQSLDEIKKITQLSVSNIKVLLHRSRKRFYSFLCEELKHEIHSLR